MIKKHVLYFLSATVLSVFAADSICENLLIQTSNFTPYTCRLVGHKTKGDFVAYTYPQGSILPGQSVNFVVGPGYHNFYSKRTDIIMTYNCGGDEFSIQSVLTRCGREPEATVLEGDKFFKVESETLRGRDTDEGNVGYGVVHWFIESKKPTSSLATQFVADSTGITRLETNAGVGE